MEKDSTEPIKPRDGKDDTDDAFQSSRTEKEENEERESDDDDDDDDDDRSDGGKKERKNLEKFHQRVRFPTLERNCTPTRKPCEYKLVFTTEKKDTSSEKPRKRLNAKFNSFTYSESENVEFLRRHQYVNPQSIRRLAVVRWMMNFLVGFYVALIAIAVTICTKYLTAAKLAAVYALIKDCRHPVCLVLPTFVWMAINMTLIFIGSYFVTFHAPLAAGSGIPNVKCYLNGIRMPGLMSLRTLAAKAGGVILSVAGGLACGKEGPMIHSGAICASGLARAELRCGKKTWRPQVCEPLRTDEERRDFVAAGAASGVSAAFGSPVGGVLFSLEEGTSFVKQMLTWRMLFSSMTACIVLNFLLSAISGHPEDMSHPGLVSFGHIGEVSFHTFELLFFVLMGTFGGLTGAVFVHLNYRVTLFRRKYVTNPWLKVAEAVFVASCSAIIFVTLIYVIPDCQPIRDFNVTYHSPSPSNDTDVISDENSTRESEDDDDVTPFTTPFSNQSRDEEEGHDPYGFHEGHGYVFQGFCPYGEHNRMADILFKTGEGGLHAMLHEPLDEWRIVPLLVLFVVYHLLATWTYGLSVSSGVFIPSLLIGAIWGRIVGIAVMTYIPSAGTNVAKYVLVGAAANLGGATRMTLSLTVIIIECTGDITFGVPIMLALIVAKWTGDYFNPGIYDLHIEIQGIPLLPWEPPAMSYAIKASDVMTSPVTCLRSRESIETLQSILHSPYSHNGYPVVSNELPPPPPPSSITSASGFERFTQNNNNNNRNGGLDKKCRLSAEEEEVEASDAKVSGASTVAEMKGNKTYGPLFGFLHTKDIEYIIANASAENKDEVDLEPFIDRTPYSIHLDTSLPRLFKIFRGLGLRHLIVVNDRYQVVGIITRVNLARYRGEMHKGNFVLEELKVVN